MVMKIDYAGRKEYGFRPGETGAEVGLVQMKSSANPF
jgi:hypothetical protein